MDVSWVELLSFGFVSKLSVVTVAVFEIDVVLPARATDRRSARKGIVEVRISLPQAPRSTASKAASRSVDYATRPRWATTRPSWMTARREGCVRYASCTDGAAITTRSARRPTARP
jgi:hypothetical protein